MAAAFGELGALIGEGQAADTLAASGRPLFGAFLLVGALCGFFLAAIVLAASSKRGPRVFGWMTAAASVLAGGFGAVLVWQGKAPPV